MKKPKNPLKRARAGRPRKFIKKRKKKWF